MMPSDRKTTCTGDGAKTLDRGAIEEHTIELKFSRKNWRKASPDDENGSGSSFGSKHPRKLRAEETLALARENHRRGRRSQPGGDGSSEVAIPSLREVADGHRSDERRLDGRVARVTMGIAKHIHVFLIACASIERKVIIRDQTQSSQWY
jgi:hypothetical protein